jgi:large subunit ribosomal protein L6
MSRLAKKPVVIPQGTTVSTVQGELRVKGPQGELARSLRPEVTLTLEGAHAYIKVSKSGREAKALAGTFFSHLRNMIAGVNKPFEKRLIIEGIGFKAEVKGKDLILNLGFSHPVKKEIPQNLKVTSEKGVIAITGVDKERVGQFAAEVRSLKKPEPYKGKGIRYENEVVKRKQGKKTA